MTKCWFEGLIREELKTWRKCTFPLKYMMTFCSVTCVPSSFRYAYLWLVRWWPCDLGRSPKKQPNCARPQQFRVEEPLENSRGQGWHTEGPSWKTTLHSFSLLQAQSLCQSLTLYTGQENPSSFFLWGLKIPDPVQSRHRTKTGSLVTGQPIRFRPSEEFWEDRKTEGLCWKNYFPVSVVTFCAPKQPTNPRIPSPWVLQCANLTVPNLMGHRIPQTHWQVHAFPLGGHYLNSFRSLHPF